MSDTTTKVRDLGIEVADRLNLVRTLARVYDLTFNIDKIPQIEDKIRNYSSEQEGNQGKILIPLVMGRNDFGTYLDVILAHAFRVRGYEPTLLLCDHDLDMCLAKQYLSRESAACEVCNFMGSEYLHRFGLDFISLSEFDAKSKTYTSKEDTYRGIDIDGIATSSARSYLKVYNLNKFDESDTIHNRFKKSAKLLTDIAFELFEQNEFDTVISNNSAYLIGAVFLRAGAQFDVPGWDVDVGFRSQSVLCGNVQNRSSLPTFPDQESAAERLREPLSDDESVAIEEFMEDRMSGRDVRFNHAQLGDESFDFSHDKTVYGAFTNLPWDGSLTATDKKTFEDVFTWVDRTIEIFKDNPHLALCIKTHPAEVLRETNESFYEWITTEYELPENISILEPDTEINPYEFMNAVDRGLVWNSTTGLEMSYLGVPVIVSGDTHYREYGFTFDPLEEKEYQQLLLKSELDMTDHMNKLAKRYAHYLFIERHVEFPYYETVNGDFQPIAPTHDQLTPGNENIDILINAIVNNSPIPGVREQKS